MSHPLAGRWFNQHGSTLDLAVSPTGDVSGAFVTRSGLARAEETFKVIGFATTDLITFSVYFVRHDCLTSWVGHAFGAGSLAQIEALWQMALKTVGVVERAEHWRGNWCGADLFRRSPVPDGSTSLSRPSHPVLG